MDGPDWNGFAKDVLKTAASKGAFKHGYASFYDVSMGFLHAVDWQRERWLQVLLLGEVLVAFIAFVSRRNAKAQSALFLMISALVFCGEMINSLCQAHWVQFSTQNYFDSNGVFAGVIFSMPLLMLLFAIVANLVYLSSELLVTTKVSCFVVGVTRGSNCYRDSNFGSRARRKTDPNIIYIYNFL